MSFEDHYPPPHPDCKAPHAYPARNEYTGSTHACAGKNCPAAEHKQTRTSTSSGERVTLDKDAVGSVRFFQD